MEKLACCCYCIIALVNAMIISRRYRGVSDEAHSNELLRSKDRWGGRGTIIVKLRIVVVR